MKRNEQLILLGVVVLVLLAGFWFVILSPKRNEASKLQDDVNQLQSSLSEAKQEVAAAQGARKTFGVDYRRLVVLGKAVPADSDQTSLLVQLQDLADRAGVKFQTFDLAAGTTTTPPPPTTTDTNASDTSASTDSGSSDSSSSSSTDTAAAVPSESAVSTLPIGASVGPAGLPIMPYTLGFSGDFFQIADFMQSLDRMVQMRGGTVDVQGRLLTVDGFTLSTTPDPTTQTPKLSAELNVTSFVTPADQGITAGATPSGPAAATPAPVSTTTTPPAPTATSSAATPTSTSP